MFNDILESSATELMQQHNEQAQHPQNTQITIIIISTTTAHAIAMTAMINALSSVIKSSAR